MTTGSPPSITATTEFVVPRSIPMILLMVSLVSFCLEAPAAPQRQHGEMGSAAEARQADLFMLVSLLNLSVSLSTTEAKPGLSFRGKPQFHKGFCVYWR